MTSFMPTLREFRRKGSKENYKFVGETVAGGRLQNPKLQVPRHGESVQGRTNPRETPKSNIQKLILLRPAGAGLRRTRRSAVRGQTELFARRLSSMHDEWRGCGRVTRRAFAIFRPQVGPRAVCERRVFFHLWVRNHASSLLRRLTCCLRSLFQAKEISPQSGNGQPRTHHANFSLGSGNPRLSARGDSTNTIIGPRIRR